MSLVAPSAREESWRYSNVKAVAAAWPATAAQLVPHKDEPVLVTLAKGHAAAQHFVLKDGDVFTLPQMQGHTRISVLVPAHVSATVIEPLTGDGWLNHAVDLILSEQASLTHIVRQERDATALTTCTWQITMTDHAHYAGFMLNTGSDSARLHVRTGFAGEDASFNLAAVQIGAASQSLDLITETLHIEACNRSDQQVRTVLADQATGTYLGKIEVSAGAQKTDAAQSSKAMLLARTATMNTKPELIIHADDVKCAHGATVGELDKQALFYMAARGISPDDAKALLIQAFVGDALDAISDDSLRSDMADRATAKLRQVVRHA